MASSVLLVLLLMLAACTSEPSGSSGPPASASASVVPSEAPTPTATPAPTATPTPTATPAPPLSLELPLAADSRQVSVEVSPDVAPDGGGQITVTVTSAAEERIDDLVLRWPSELAETLFLAPFVPSEDRRREGGDPLVQPWTKWVLGPGERGEPAGTTSLGYGPLLPGATLTIPLYVTRNAPGPVAFDLQVLAGELILVTADGTAAELRVEVP